MLKKLNRLLILSILILVTFACEKDPTGSKDDETITDIDGNIYQTVTIGDQVWLAENLKVTHFRNGDAIPNVNPDLTDWTNYSTEAYCYYDNTPENADIYGLLYNWNTVDDSRGIAPDGWHVPSDEEWQLLFRVSSISCYL